jgi:hypothetical protein
MRAATAFGFTAVFMMVGAATADGPMVPNEAQLDGITAGAELAVPGVFILELPGPDAEPPPPGDLVIQFEVHPAQDVRGILQNAADPRWDAADPGFNLDPPRPIITGRVPN